MENHLVLQQQTDSTCHITTERRTRTYWPMVSSAAFALCSIPKCNGQGLLAARRFRRRQWPTQNDLRRERELARRPDTRHLKKYPLDGLVALRRRHRQKLAGLLRQI